VIGGVSNYYQLHLNFVATKNGEKFTQNQIFVSQKKKQVQREI